MSDRNEWVFECLLLATEIPRETRKQNKRPMDKTRKLRSGKVRAALKTGC